MRSKPELKDNLWKITNALQNGLKKAGFNIGDTNSCVTPVYMNGSIPEATNLIFDLRENFNIFCSMVVYPVVPKGMIILRIIPTAVHTLEDVNYTIDAFSKIVGKLKAGEYMGDKIAAH
jgi:glycine C-acetyltransferase